jgi:O-antigen ligase
MTALSCLAIGGMVMVLSTLPSIANRPAHLNGLVAVSIGLAFSALFVSSMGTLVHSLGRNSTLTGRTEIWAAVLAVHINPLLGAGFESFWLGNRLQEVWDRSMPGIQEAHNGYLELYVNLGWAGLALLGALIVTGYSHALAVFRIDQHAGRLRLALFTSGVIYSFTEAGFRMMCIIWIAFLLAITAVPPELLDEQPQVEAKLNLAWLIRRRPVRILQ